MNSASKILLLLILPIWVQGQNTSFAFEQVNGMFLVNNGYRGEGVKIGIIDGGFLGAPDRPSLERHFTEGRVAYYRDFITPDTTPYSGYRSLNDEHGTTVWELIAGKTALVQYGMATDAIFYLARTDHGGYERRIEEKYLIEAMSEMIDLGVRLFNVSLGYTNGYNDKKENYTPFMIDGKSTWISRSLDSLLTAHPSTLVVISAGNDGDSNWRVVSAPADIEQVLAVGSGKFGQSEEMGFSSRGSEKLSYVKPEVICFSSSGTSYSAPVITGLAACLWAEFPDMSAQEIKSAIIQSGNLSPYPNNFMGYGTPNAEIAFSILNGKSHSEPNIVKTDRKKVPLSDLTHSELAETVTIYHCQSFNVIDKQRLKLKSKSKTKIKRVKKSDRTTVCTSKEVFHILWQ